MADPGFVIDAGIPRSRELSEPHRTTAADKVRGSGRRLMDIPGRVAAAIVQRWDEADPSNPRRIAEAERERAIVRMAALRDKLRSQP